MIFCRILLLALLAACFPCHSKETPPFSSQITPGTIAYEARQTKQKFTFTLPSGAASSAALQAEVVFRHGANPPRIYPARTLDGRTFETDAVPLPAAEQLERLRLTVQDNAGELVCVSRDFPIRVAGKSVMLSAISRMDLGDRRRVTLADGQALEGAVSGLDKIPVLLFGKVVSLDLNKASSVLVEDVAHLPLTVRFTILLRQNKQLVFEQSGAFQVAPPVAVAAPANVAAPNRPRRANLPLTFKPAKLYDVPAATDVVTVGRIDEDRTFDVVVAAGQEIGILYGQDDGTFLPYTRVLSWKASLRNELLTDVNGDSRPDIVFTDGLGRFVLLLNQGRRRFANPIFKNLGGITGLSVLDINRDRFPDLVGMVSGAGVKILLNDGKGNFQEQPTLSSGDINGVTMSDVNGDGILDFAISNQSSVAIVFGTAEGKQRAGGSYALGSQGLPRPCLADFNQDGKPDLVQCIYWSHHIAILLNKGDGTFDTPIRYPASGYPLMAFPADFNGDGILDLAVAGPGSHVAVYRNRGDGTFADPEMIPTGGDDARSCAIADINRDGKPDLVSQNQATRTIAVMLNSTGG